ncbi:MAG: hypothetical protein WDN00_12015 [Limisphaerales bacterium]
MNLLFVFVLCGLWHGAGWTYIVFGLYQAFFVIMERTRFGVWQGKLPGRHATSMPCLFSWMSLVIFRSDTFTYALHYFTALFGANHPSAPQPLARYLSHESMWALAFGIPFCGPLWGWIKTTCIRLGQATPSLTVPECKTWDICWKPY